MGLRRALFMVVVCAWIATAAPAGAAAGGGDVLPYGAPDRGSLKNTTLTAPIVDLAAAPDGSGYWEVASDGGVFAFGGAHFAGSLGNIKLNQPIVGMAPTRTGRGYWLAASDGGVFTIGDAKFYGSAGGSPPPEPVVGIVASPTGAGYWLVTSAGAVYPYGAATQFGDLTTNRQSHPVVGMAATALGDGYWLATSDGGVFTFGRAPFAGSLGGEQLTEPVVGIDAPATGGYYLVLRDGAVRAFGGAADAGSAANACKDAVFGMAVHLGGGYWLGTTPLPGATWPPETHPLDQLAAESAQATELLHLRQGCEPGASARRGILSHPLAGARITGGYGPRTHPIYHRYQFHTGTDFAGGTTAHAAADGYVIEVRQRVGFGLFVIIDHGNGIATAYAHLARAAVSVGQAVGRGQAIGTVGHSGFATGDHLHFEVRVHGVTTDPMSWL